MITHAALLEAAYVAVTLTVQCGCGCGRMVTRVRQFWLLAPSITGEA